MTPEDRARLINRYQDGYRAVVEALDRIGPRSLDAARQGEWSAREIVHHLADTELFRSTRLRALLSEDEPFLPGFDEQRLQQRLHYYRPVEASLALFNAAIDSNIELLTLLFPEDWLRSGRHERLGSFTIETWLERAAAHPHEHAAQLRALADR
jgi:hypothetical protein